MMKCVLAATVLSIATASFAEKPIWEFHAGKIPPKDIVGDIHAKGTSFFLDGTNCLRLPAGILGVGKDYTIEFDVKVQNRKDVNLIVFAMQDNDYEKGSFRMKVEQGFGLGLYGYGAGHLYMNNSQTEMGVNEHTQPIPWKGEGKYWKLTFVVKDGRVQYFRNGLLLMQTDSCGTLDKDTVLRFGQLRGEKGTTEKLKTPLEIHNLKIYDKVVYPTGYDDSVKERLNHSGPEYSLMRVPVKDPKRKRVLIVGDSISMAYRSEIAKRLEGKAYVDYWVGGVWFGPDVMKGGKKSKPYVAWKGVAGNGPYDVITFNPMTIHWWGRGGCKESYLADTLQGYFDAIKAAMPNAKVIWVNCTPIRTVRPDGTGNLDNDSTRRIRKFNAICQDVVDRNKIPTVDLFSVAEKHVPNVPKTHRDGVHWDKECDCQFSEAVYEKVEKALQAK